MATPAATEPRIHWSVYAGGHGTPLVRIPKTSTMPAADVPAAR